MFLYFKFTKKCPQHSSLTTIVSSDIVVNYKKEDPTNTKYKVFCGCKGATKCSGSVGLAAESMEELQKLIKTVRPKWPPNKVLESAASDLSSSEDIPHKSKKTSELKGKKLEERGAKINLLARKLSEINESKVNSPSVSQPKILISRLKSKDNQNKKEISSTNERKKTAVSKDTKIANMQNATNDMVSKIAVSTSKSGTTTKDARNANVKNNLKRTLSKEQSKVRENSFQAMEPKKLEMPKDCLKKSEESKKLSATDSSKDKPKIRSSLVITKPKSVQKSNNLKDEQLLQETEKETDEFDGSDLVIEYLKKINNMELENKSLRTLILNMKHKSNDDNNDVERIFNEETDSLLRDYRRQIIQLEMENRSLKKSNIRMQDKVVNCFEKVHSSIKRVNTTAQQELETKLLSGEQLEIGEVNPATNEIHAGHGIWIDRDVYDTIRFQPKVNAQKFIKGVATAIFSNEVLKNSTVKGLKYGKSGLPPVGLKALADFSKFWMVKIKKMDTSEVHKELRNITNYLNHKIADLNRDLTKKRKRSSRRDTDKSQKKPKTKNSKELIQDVDSNDDDTNGTSKTNGIEAKKGVGAKNKTEMIILERVEYEEAELKELVPQELDNSDPLEFDVLNSLEATKDKDEKDKRDEVNDFPSMETEEAIDDLVSLEDEDGDEKGGEGTEDEESKLAEKSSETNNDEDKDGDEKGSEGTEGEEGKLAEKFSETNNDEDEADEIDVDM